MGDLYEPDRGTAFYRSTDPIKNLHIRVTLERMTSAVGMPPSITHPGNTDALEMTAVGRDNSHLFGGMKDVEAYTFKWQEKVFSQREIELYEKEENCETVLEKKYHNDVLKVLEHGRPTRWLFSYTDSDNYIDPEGDVARMTTAPDEKPTVLSEKMRGIRHRRIAPQRLRAINTPMSKVSIVDYNPTEEQRKKNHYLSLGVQTMYIMADVHPDSRPPQPDDEFVLCVIQMDSRGVLSVQPDFNKGRKPYRLVAGVLGSGRDMFEFVLEHSSKQLTSQQQSRELKMYKQLYSRHAAFLAESVGREFEMPPLDVLRLLVYGEIELAQNFEYGDLYVQYFIELPDDWCPNGPQRLSGVTQTCSTKSVERDEVAYFSYPFNFELLHKKNPLNEKEIASEGLMKWPQLFIEVLSLDSWGRYRTEGYGYMTLPCNPGVFRMNIHCWRPAGRSCISNLRRFFIGGSPELEDPLATSVPSAFEGKHISKFGFKTVSTGFVTIKLNIIQQAQAYMETKAAKKKTGSIMSHLGYSAVHANIMSVLDAFQQAKRRMMDARENLHTEYVETLKMFDAGDTEA
ncbi:hypothetical protein NP493_736g04038 [Ridgeia piscesae]|uniref:Meckel syndrome type 1 protein n=1 Tax=Ridgeia piscesae TaxID=27915 RepID=A0AAD9KPK4_RIDPI|nr:hypothetical protein NP493_736g04038 [Ridgeia piscesae]